MRRVIAAGSWCFRPHPPTLPLRKGKTRRRVKELQVAHVCNARITRMLTNHSLDQGQKPILISILGEKVYNELLAVDPAPIVLEINTIATQPGGDFSFLPKYDLTVPRSLMEQAARSWEGLPYTNGHTPEYAEWKPDKLGRILKCEVRVDGLWQYIYAFDGNDNYRGKVQAEGVLFPEKLVRPVSSEFFVSKGENNEIVAIRPILVAEVDNANVMGSGVKRVLNDSTHKTSMEVLMELDDKTKKLLINGLTLEDVKGTNIFQLIENDFRKRATDDKEIRAAVLTKLTKEERLPILNESTEEVVKEATKLVGVATKIVNDGVEEARRLRKILVEDVVRLFKNEGKMEIDDAAATHLIVENDWKSGEEAKIKKYIEFGNGFGVASKEFWKKVLNTKKEAVTTASQPAVRDEPVSNEGGFIAFMQPGAQKSR